MKEFEKWWNLLKFDCPISNKQLVAWEYYAHIASKDIARDVWKAALCEVYK